MKEDTILSKNLLNNLTTHNNFQCFNIEPNFLAVLNPDNVLKQFALTVRLMACCVCEIELNALSLVNVMKKFCLAYSPRITLCSESVPLGELGCVNASAAFVW